MKICIINGSPRKEYSTTLQTFHYLEKRYPNDEFGYFQVGNSVRPNEQRIAEIMAAMDDNELIIFSYPVYTFIAPSQLHRFIVEIKKSGHDFSGKFVTQVTTSKHFYDVTAHRYVEENCHDLGMKVIHGLSLDMEDLLAEEGRNYAEKFFEYAKHCVENDIYEVSGASEVSSTSGSSADGSYTSSETIKAELTKGKSDKYDTVIVADLRPGDENLKNMIADFEAIYPYKTRLINIYEYDFKGGCIGCFNCAGTGECIHKDGFDKYLREVIQTADSIIYAFTMRDHSMGEIFKTYDDRQFCNGHRTVTEGMPIGYLISGDYSSEENLKTIIKARAEVGHNFLAGDANSYDEILMMVDRLDYALKNSYYQPRNFYGVGGMKIFRDLIWLMRGLMKADHDFYKKHGIYDFPQKQRGKMLMMCFLGAMVRNPKIKVKMGNKMNEGMVAPYKKVIDAAEPKNVEETKNE